MSKRPIEDACDPDLRLSFAALQRAAVRARQLAVQTQTDLIISEQGVIRKISPADLSEWQPLQEPSAGYGKPP